MGVRAKFYVNYVSTYANGQSQVVMAPVCRGEDNKEWSKYTPSGEIKMTILNELAAKQFEPGKEYYVDFTLCQKQGEEG